MVDRLQPDLTTKNIRAGGYSLFPFLAEMRNSWDIVTWEDDFLGDSLDAKYPAATTGVDGSFDKIAGGISGEATIDVGDGANSADNEYGGIGLGGLEWKGDLNCFTVARIKQSALATCKVEFGFTDSFGDAGAVNDLAAGSATADEAAVFVVDTDDTTTWQHFTVKAGGTPVKDETLIYNDVAGTATVTPIADTYQYMGVFLEGDNAIFKTWDASGSLVSSVGISGAIEGGVAVGPWLFVQNRAGTIDRLVTIDYIMTGQRRS